MNHTKNYNLPQWELNDLIRMEDFNSAMSSLENGMTSTAGIAKGAQETAENARKTAVAAYSPANKPYATGSYTGNGAQFRDITVGFRPSFLLICTSQMTHLLEFASHGLAMAGPDVNSRHIYLTDQGFHLDYTDTTNIHPRVNEDGAVYNYIAFR